MNIHGVIASFEAFEIANDKAAWRAFVDELPLPMLLAIEGLFYAGRNGQTDVLGMVDELLAFLDDRPDLFTKMIANIMSVDAVNPQNVLQWFSVKKNILSDEPVLRRIQNGISYLGNMSLTEYENEVTTRYNEKLPRSQGCSS